MLVGIFLLLNDKFSYLLSMPCPLILYQRGRNFYFLLFWSLKILYVLFFDSLLKTCITLFQRGRKFFLWHMYKDFWISLLFVLIPFFWFCQRGRKIWVYMFQFNQVEITWLLACYFFNSPWFVFTSHALKVKIYKD